MKQTLITILTLLFIPQLCRASEARDSVPHPGAAPVITETAMSAAFVVGITEALKHSVHRMRPDRHNTESFPSRHTALAFTASSIVSAETYRYTPWVPTAAHLAASAIGLQRVASLNHYGTDVGAGAAIGILSTEVSMALSRLIFRHSAPGFGCPDALTRGITVSSTMVLPLGHGYASGWRTAANALFPLSESIAVGPCVAATALAPAGTDPVRKSPQTFCAAFAAQWRVFLPCPALSLHIDASAGPALSRNMAHSRFGADASAGISLAWRLTKAFGASAGAGVSAFLSRKSFCATGVSVASTAYF